MKNNFVLLFLTLVFLGGCAGHSQSQVVGLMSFGDLEDKLIPENIEGQVLSGEDCGHSHYLSNAVRDAIKDTEYDTLMDASVTSDTGVFVWSNCIKVRGTAIASHKLSGSGGNK